MPADGTALVGASRLHVGNSNVRRGPLIQALIGSSPDRMHDDIYKRLSSGCLRHT